jgi:hypothetical protein
VRLDQHFLQELFDCADADKAASLATMMLEELLDAILDGAARGMLEQQPLRECTLAQKIEVASSLRLVDHAVIAAMRHLTVLNQRHSREVSRADYEALALPDLDLELRKSRGHERVGPAVQVNVALCHLLLRLADYSERVSDHEG